MLVGLKEKLKSWFEERPGKFLPVQAAAVALAIKNQIEQEDWEGDEKSRQLAINALGAICNNLYFQHAISEGTDAGTQAHKELEYILRHAISDHRHSTGIGIPQELVPEYNKIASPGKRKFLEQARALTRRLAPSYQELHRRLESISYTGDKNAQRDANLTMERTLMQLSVALSAVQHTLITANLAHQHMPTDGPKNTDEMILCASAFLTSQRRIERVRASMGMPEYTEMLRAAEHVTALILDTQGDLPSGLRNNIAQTHVLPIVSEVLKTHDLRPEKFSGLLHFFLEHNQQKMSLSEYARMRAALVILRQSSMVDFGRKYTGRDAYALSSEQLLAVEEFSGQRHQDYTKPSSEAVVLDTRANIRTAYQGKPRRVEKNIQGFEEARAARPEGMEEVVLLHYEESEQIRELRKKLFKAQKEKFIKTLAAENAEELGAIGLTAEQIDDMGETGRIPEGSGLTVEHIIDRHHGGTNQIHNFILMSREINEAKNELKRYQINAAKDADKGCWIISWVPKKNADGTYPKIFNPAREGGKQQPDLTNETGLHI